MANYAASCATKLRADKTCCRSLQVFIQTNPHKTDEAQYLRSIDIDLDRASNHSGEIIKAALRGLDLIFKPGFLIYEMRRDGDGPGSGILCAGQFF